VNSARHLKQVRKRINRCIDFAQLRQSLCAKRFGDWLEKSIVFVLGNTSPRLLVRIRFVAEPGMRGGKV
jgi:hypothetical protein